MGVGERNSTRSQAINVGCFALRMSAQHPDPVVEVVDRDEENVRTPLGGCRHAEQQGGGQRHGWDQQAEHGRAPDGHQGGGNPRYIAHVSGGQHVGGPQLVGEAVQVAFVVPAGSLPDNDGFGPVLLNDSIKSIGYCIQGFIPGGLLQFAVFPDQGRFQPLFRVNEVESETALDTEAAEMEALEVAALASLGWPDPY